MQKIDGFKMLSNSLYQFGPFFKLDGFSGSRDFSHQNGIVSAEFIGKDDSYVLNYDLPESLFAVGVHALINLQNWKKIHYVAIGYSTSAGFQHIKIKNIRHNAWVKIGFSHHDVIWLLQNRSNGIENTEIGNIRLFIKGEPLELGAAVQIKQLEAQLQPYDNSLIHQHYENNKIEDVLYEHLNQALRNYKTNAKTYLTTGNCPMPGDKVLDWPDKNELPLGLLEVSTFQATWHAQHLPLNLLQYARETGDLGSVFAARSLIEKWLENNFDKLENSNKYIWYDHGTAERQLAFILMWCRAIEHGMELRFLNRLGEAIVQHARLLNSEAFYAYHQPLRYHNHAWFQDAALLATALVFNKYPEAQDWLTNAISRFEDQLDTLIVRDGGYAIFVENSIGYHHGVQRLAQLVGKLASLSGRETEIPVISDELVAWSDFLRYPDGRAPAQGDTFRLSPRTGDDVRRGKPWVEPSCTILPKAGYAVIKGNHDNKPWMLCLFNTSLSSTHKHEDNCSITLWFDGVEWLTDPSFHSYEPNDEIAKYLRSAEAHNCVHISGLEYSLEPGRTKIEGKVEGDSFFIKASHTCYEGVQVVREIKGILTEFGFEVFDIIQNGSEYNCEQNLIFPENVNVSNNNGFLETWSEDSAVRLNFTKHNGVSSDIKKQPIGIIFRESKTTAKMITRFLVKLRMKISIS